MHQFTNAREVPLTFTQRVQLLIECLPAVLAALALVFALTWYRALTDSGFPLFLVFFLCLFIFFMGWIAVGCVRDLIAGVALVQEDVLEASQRLGRTARSRSFSGQFMQLGKMRLMPQAYKQGQHGIHYRVLYSPISKIVWSLETVE